MVKPDSEVHPLRRLHAVPHVVCEGVNHLHPAKELIDFMSLCILQDQSNTIPACQRTNPRRRSCESTSLSNGSAVLVDMNCIPRCLQKLLMAD